MKYSSISFLIFPSSILNSIAGSDFALPEEREHLSYDMPKVCAVRTPRPQVDDDQPVNTRKCTALYPASRRQDERTVRARRFAGAYYRNRTWRRFGGNLGVGLVMASCDRGPGYLSANRRELGTAQRTIALRGRASLHGGKSEP